MASKYREDLEGYWDRFVCLDAPADLVLRGDLDAATASILDVVVSRCDSSEEDNCKPDEVTREHFADKYFVILTNDIRFDSKNFGEDAIIRESTLTWLEYSMSVTQYEEFKIKQMDLYLQDLVLNLDSLT